MNGGLYLDYCGEEYHLSPTDTLTFGRSAELVIDDNPYMHRIVGRFICIDAVWVVENACRRGSLDVRDLTGPSLATAAPGRAAALLFGDFSCRFGAGPTRYELTGALEDFEWEIDLLGPDGAAGTRTKDWGRVELNDDQRLLLLAMCENRLRDPSNLDSPPITNRQGASRLGWSIAKFNRKLDHLCEKLRRAGVAGVHGELGANAIDRRRCVIEHALSVPLVSPEELRLLDLQRPAA